MSDIKQDVLNIMNESDTDENLPDEVSDELSSVVKSINNESDADKLKDLTKLFNLAMLKKEINRAEKQSDILDFALSEVHNRLLTGEVSDKALGTYIKVLQDNINNVRKATTEETIPAIQINTKEININNNEGLTREERENVVNFIQKILTQSKNENIIDVKSEERNTEDDD